jgi:hypothetical protein
MGGPSNKQKRQCSGGEQRNRSGSVISLSKHNCMIKVLISLPWTLREILCAVKIIELTKIFMARSLLVGE